MTTVELELYRAGKHHQLSLSSYLAIALLIMFIAAWKYAVEQSGKIKELKQPSKKYLDAKKYLGEAVIKFEQYLKNHPEDYQQAVLGHADHLDSSARRYRASKRNVNLVLEQIFKTRTELSPEYRCVFFVNETGGPYEAIIPIEEIQKDLAMLIQIRDGLSPFDLNEFNPSDLLVCGV